MSMKKPLLFLLGVLLVMFVAVLPALAQEAAPSKEKPAEEKAAPAEKPKAEAMKPETIAGTLQMVVTDKKIVVVADSTGTPFNFKVTGATRIKVGGKRAKLVELAGQTSKTVSVKFLPLHTGNVAQSIEVQ
jgi:hypothetical protein